MIEKMQELIDATIAVVEASGFQVSKRHQIVGVENVDESKIEDSISSLIQTASSIIPMTGGVDAVAVQDSAEKAVEDIKNTAAEANDALASAAITDDPVVDPVVDVEIADDQSDADADADVTLEFDADADADADDDDDDDDLTGTSED